MNLNLILQVSFGMDITVLREISVVVDDLEKILSILLDPTTQQPVKPGSFNLYLN